MNIVNKDMFEEKRRVSEEINQLGYTKQNAQSQLFMIAEAQKRLSKEGLQISGTGARSGTGSGAGKSNIPVLLGGRNLPSPLLMSTQTQKHRDNSTSNIGFGSGSGLGLGLGVGYNNNKVNIQNNQNNQNINQSTPADQLQTEIMKLKLQSASVLKKQ